MFKLPRVTLYFFPQKDHHPHLLLDIKNLNLLFITSLSALSLKHLTILLPQSRLRSIQKIFSCGGITNLKPPIILSFYLPLFQLAISNQLQLNLPKWLVTLHLHILLLLHLFYFHFFTILLLASFICDYIETPVSDSTYRFYYLSSTSPLINNNKIIIFIIELVLRLKINQHITSSSSPTLLSYQPSTAKNLKPEDIKHLSVAGHRNLVLDLTFPTI